MSFTSLYTKDQLAVQRGLYEAVPMQFFDALKAIITSTEWEGQVHPVPRQLLVALCPRNHVTDQFVCAFCPGVTFTQPGRALEHIQQHFGLRPFQCTVPGCRRTFLRNNELNNHSNTHLPPVHIPCPNGCGSLFSSDKNIQRHLEETCNPPDID